jgi:tetratricopeptide (TPR) repeat protein
MSVLQPVLENEAELRVLNDYGWGGYLGWYGAGMLKIYIDGRTPTVFSEGLMLSQILARQKPNFLRDLCRRWQVQAIVLRRTARLPIPVTDPEWKLVAFDSISMLYLRADLAGKYRISGLGFDPFSVWPRIDARHVEQAITQLRDLLAFDANNDLAWLRLGQLLGYFEPRATVAQHAEAMQAVQHAIELNAENVPAYLALANLHLKAGDSNARVAQPLLTLLEQVNAQGLAGHEVEIATLLLRTGYFNQVIEVLSPESWALHQQLDQAFDVWLLRMQAHARLGDRDAFELDRRMAEGLAQDAGAAAWKQLESAMRAIENFWRKAEK